MGALPGPSLEGQRDIVAGDLLGFSGVVWDVCMHAF